MIQRMSDPFFKRLSRSLCLASSLAMFLSSPVHAFWIFGSSDKPANLIVQPNALELRGANPEHGLLVTAVATDGRTEITVSYKGVSQKIPIHLADTTAIQPLSFRQDIIPILTRNGCNQGGCHGKFALVPHEGGQRLTEDGRAHRTLIEWITQRAPGPIASESNASRIEILPGGPTLRVGETQQLLVRPITPMAACAM